MCLEFLLQISSTKWDVVSIIDVVTFSLLLVRVDNNLAPVIIFFKQLGCPLILCMLCALYVCCWSYSQGDHQEGYIPMNNSVLQFSMLIQKLKRWANHDVLYRVYVSCSWFLCWLQWHVFLFSVISFYVLFPGYWNTRRTIILFCTLFLRRTYINLSLNNCGSFGFVAD